MLYEANDNLARAESIYDDILSQDPANEVILKRKVKQIQEFVNTAPH